MNHKRIPVERLCRLDGAEPTTRDKWYAFHRLYRITQGQGHWQDMAAVDCLRTMCGDWRWIQLLEAEEKCPSRVQLPKFLRKLLLEQDRKQRLYGDHPEWAERDKVVARAVREQHGMEVTPDEVAEVRRKVLTIARTKAAEQGLTLPADDEDVLRLLKKE